MKHSRRVIAGVLLALVAFTAFGCLTARGRRRPQPRKIEKVEPHKKPPHHHK
ncbi:MAG: hypothetical protein JXD23_16435 [Spirochaetales bacterium]|nr:hypothetical protein [Spirochaetales bacterium]